jgi:HK97 family phage prohead protease
MTILPLTRFKTLVREHRAVPAGSMIRKQMLTKIDTLENRTLRFTISNSGVDRAMDTVAVEGWELTRYRQNPVVLWSHHANELPIGRVIEIGVVGDALKATVEFVDSNMPCIGEKAEAIFQLCKSGFLNATSVGFEPLEFAMTSDPDRGGGDWFPGIDFTKQELLELSIVTVPCNPDALIEPGQQQFDQPDQVGPNETVPPGDGTEERAAEAAIQKRERADRARIVRNLLLPR